MSEIDDLLARKRTLDGRVAAAPAFALRLRELQAWQAMRLAHTYADLRQDARYSAAAEFFLSDVYGSDKTAQRDSDLERAWRYMKRALPRAALEVLGRALALDVLSAELDHAMAERLSEAALSATTYAAAYRRVGRAAERRRQIELLVAIGADLDRIAQRAWISGALRAAHVPAHAAGFGVLQDFLERGLKAFQRMGGAEEFLAEIRARETKLLKALMRGECPFESELKRVVAR